MVDNSNKSKRGFITEGDVASLLQRYEATTVLKLLQEVACFTGPKIDWNALVKKTSTGITNAREYQMLWRHLAYRDSLFPVEDDTQPLDDDSDVEYELEAVPHVNGEASLEAAAHVKVMVSSYAPSDSNIPNNSTVEAPLTINIPNGLAYKGSQEPSESPWSSRGINITFPVSLQKAISTEGLSGNGSASGSMAARKKRKKWSTDEDEELIAAVKRCGEGNWAHILKGEFKGDRTASQLSQRWALIRKRCDTTSSVANQSGLQRTEAQMAANHALSLAVGNRAPARKLTTGISPSASSGNSVGTLAVRGSSSHVQQQSQPNIVQALPRVAASPSVAKPRVTVKKTAANSTSKSDLVVTANSVAAAACMSGPSAVAFVSKAEHGKNAAAACTAIPSAATLVSKADPGKNSAPAMAKADPGNTSAASVPKAEPGKNAPASVATAEHGKNAAVSVTKAEPGKNTTASVPNVEPRKNATASVPNAEPRKNATALVPNAEPRKNAAVSMPNTEPRKNAAASLEKSEPGKNVDASVQKSEPRKDIVASVRKSEPAKNVAASVQMPEPSNNIAESVQKSEPGKNISASVQKTEPGKNADTSMQKSEPVENFLASVKKSEPGKNVATSVQKSEPGKNVAASVQKLEPGKNVDASLQRAELGKTTAAASITGSSSGLSVAKSELGKSFATVHSRAGGPSGTPLVANGMTASSPSSKSPAMTPCPEGPTPKPIQHASVASASASTPKSSQSATSVPPAEFLSKPNVEQPAVNNINKLDNGLKEQNREDISNPSAACQHNRTASTNPEISVEKQAIKSENLGVSPSNSIVGSVPEKASQEGQHKKERETTSQSKVANNEDDGSTKPINGNGCSKSLEAATVAEISNGV